MPSYALGAGVALTAVWAGQLAIAATFLNDITLPVFVDSSTWMGDYPPLEGLELAGLIPQDPLVAEFDGEGRPTYNLPEDSAAVKAAHGILSKLLP